MYQVISCIVVAALLFVVWRKVRKLQSEVTVLGQALVTEIERRRGEIAPQPPTKPADRIVKEEMQAHVKEFHR